MQNNEYLIQLLKEFIQVNNRVADIPSELFQELNDIIKKLNILEILKTKYPELECRFQENNDFKFLLSFKPISLDDYDKFSTIEFREELDLICKDYLNNDDLEELIIVYELE